MELWKCRRCGVEKDRSLFRSQKRGRVCMACVEENKARWYNENRARLAAADKAKRAALSVDEKARKLALQKQWYEKNRARISDEKKSERAAETPEKRAIRLATHRINSKHHYRANTERYRQRSIEKRRALKQGALDAYGNECACCGESAFEFMSIDHLDGGGSRHRAEIGSSAGTNFYRWLRRNGYPAGFRVLCHNCNQAFGAYGYCPHQKSRALGISQPSA